ncbi:MAG TPA: hypothetical protein VHB20_16310 [Verrucomicrobiae bacterium]|jgi:hypothetical protein|nr:hypothetical protein [Verrucomicrobiae bacterium]
MHARYRPAIFALAAIVAVWFAAAAGYHVFQHYKVTAESLRAYLQENDLAKLHGSARAKALRDLAAQINALSPDERREARLNRLWNKWFEEMTEAEKSDFLEATLPSGFKQMLASFEQQPADKRQKAIDNAVKRLREARLDPAPNSTNSAGTNGSPVLSDDLQKKVAMMGLQSVYTTSSAQSKAELAPLLEEIQKNMEMGRAFRGN